MEVAASTPAAIMCAEAVPWRCHRSLIGDALLARGVAVLDIFNLTNAKPHSLTPFAKVNGTEVTYPGNTGDDAGNLNLEFDGPAALS
jgi:hypothetical protein